MRIYHIFFIQLSINRHLSCFHYCGYCKFYCKVHLRSADVSSRYYFFFLNYIPRSKISRSCGNSVLIFWGIFVLLFVVAAPFTFPPIMYKVSSFSTPLLAFVIFCSFYNNHPNKCGVVSYCDLICISPNITVTEHLFHRPLTCLYAFFVEMSIQISCRPMF